MTSEELLSGTREFAVVSIRLLTDLEEGEHKGSAEIEETRELTCTCIHAQYRSMDPLPL